MPSREELVRELTIQWLNKAEDDLDAAKALLQHGSGLWSIVAFHCQQSAEKCIKAVLTSVQIEFSKTHDISILIDFLSNADNDLALALRPAEALTVYGVQVRYPGDDPDVDAQEAERALELASEVASLVRARVGH